MGFKIPYGYRIVDGLAEPDPVECEKLQMFFKHYMEGWTLEMCRTAIGINRSVRGLRSILDNPVYLGTDYYPQLIDRETWETAREQAARRGAHLKGKTGVERLIPVSIFSEFVMRPATGEAIDDPVEYVAEMYERICVRGNEKGLGAPDDLSGVFL